jgi:hypothetical protein
MLPRVIRRAWRPERTGDLPAPGESQMDDPHRHSTCRLRESWREFRSRASERALKEAGEQPPAASRFECPVVWPILFFLRSAANRCRAEWR